MTTRYESLVDMLASSDDPEIHEAKQRIEEISSKMVLARALFASRNAHGLTQAQLARKMQVARARVEEIEHCDDDQMRIQDLMMYVSAMGYRLSVGIHSAKVTDSVKYHAFEIRRMLNHLAEMCKGDSAMETAAAKFFGEAIFNLVNFVDAAASTIDAEIQMPGQDLEVFASTPLLTDSAEESQSLVPSEESAA